MGYGAMQLAGPGVFGPPKDRDAGGRRAARGDGARRQPHRHQRLSTARTSPTRSSARRSIRIRDDLVIVTKVGAMRGDDGSWNPALSPAELTRAVHDNLRNLGRRRAGRRQPAGHGRVHEPSEGSIEEPFTALAELQRQGLIRHLGLSNVTSAQVDEARGIAEVVCVQNHYNLVHRERRRARSTSWRRHGIAYVPFFPLGGFTPLQSAALSDVATQSGRHADAGGARLAAAPRAQHSADSRHLVARPPAREPRGGDS